MAMALVTGKANWLAESRAGALAAFSRLPLPSRKDELFKYTSLGDVKFDLPESKRAGQTLPADCADRDASEAALLCLGSGGREAFSEASGALARAGAELGEIGDVALPETVRAWIAREGLEWNDKFAALAAGKARSGAFFRVGKDHKLEGDARVVFSTAANGADYFHSVVFLEPGAEATFVEDWNGAEGEGLASALVDIWVSEGARLHYVSLQNFGSGTDYFLRQNVRVAAGGSVRHYGLAIGGRKGQARLDVELAGQDAEFIAVGAAQGSDSQHLDFVANFHHTAPHTTSGLKHWAVMADSAKGVFNGLVRVEREALVTDAYQKSRALLLSPKASVHAMPKLLIGTDEVACSHGASVSAVDPDQMFYLMSRGIDASEATRIIVAGFTEPVVSALPTEAMRARVRALLERKFHG